MFPKTSGDFYPATLPVGPCRAGIRGELAKRGCCGLTQEVSTGDRITAMISRLYGLGASPDWVWNNGLTDCLGALGITSRQGIMR